MNIFLGVLIGILVMTVVVTVHEFGHFIVAKRNGVNVKEFGIGFPPKAKTWLHIPTEKAKEYCKKFDLSEAKTDKILAKAEKKGKGKYVWIPLPKSEWYEETDEGLMPKTQDYLIFSLNWLPIGGFCQMDGETNIDTRKGTFGAASIWSKTKILFAGVTMNWLLAFVIFTILAWTGMPELFDNQWRVESDTFYDDTSYVEIAEVFENTPAAAAGLKSGNIIVNAKAKDDEIVTQITKASDLQTFNKDHIGETVYYGVRCAADDNCMPKDVEVTLNPDGEKYTLGISMGQFGLNKFHTTWSAPIVAAVSTVQITGETFRGLGQLVFDLFSGVASQFSSDEAVKEAGKNRLEAAGDSVSGPVGIIGVLFPAIAETGLTNTLFLVAIISISLACMNVLPIPALDGGRWFLIILFEKILRKKLTPEIENKIVSRAFIVLLILAGLVTILDVMKIVR
ncbi:site-2 protease family protein [Candidatus Saccharibacteria bacterium]|nr:site-2 protease family protein [Candidatus Saccharibacteria bacterium]